MIYCVPTTDATCRSRSPPMSRPGPSSVTSTAGQAVPKSMCSGQSSNRYRHPAAFTGPSDRPQIPFGRPKNRHGSECYSNESAVHSDSHSPKNDHPPPADYMCHVLTFSDAPATGEERPCFRTGGALLCNFFWALR